MASKKDGRSAITDDMNDLSRIESKLDTLIRLLALSVAADDLSLKERAVRLQRVGMTPKDISALCDTTANAVRVALSTAKRESKGKDKTTK